MKYICQFTTPGNQTYFWGPFPTQEDAQNFSDKSRAQYPPNEDPVMRLIRELHDPDNPSPSTVIVDLELNGEI